MQWKPILQGSLRDRALDTVWALADALFDTEADPYRGREASLAHGNAAVALFYGYHAKAHKGHGYKELAIAFLARALRSVSSPQESPALYCGTTGVAWVAAHLQDEAGHGTCLPEWTDTALLQMLNQSDGGCGVGLFGGLVGQATYALERFPRPEAIRVLEQVVERLERSAVWSERGVAWLTPADQVPEERRQEAPTGGYDLSLAHGMAGVIGLLSQIFALGVAEQRVSRLLRGAVSYIFSHRLDDSSPASFPTWITPDQRPVTSGNHSCSGDVGIAAALLMAARAFKEPSWEREALAIARRAAGRPPALYGVKEPGFCHGTAGLAHLFNRMYQATGDQELQRAARFWIEQTLALRGPKGPMAGYPADRGLVRGAAGVALALLAAATSVEPSWDRVFLLSGAH